jgi:uncharacterized protein
MIKRFLTDQIKDHLGRGRVIVLYGPRRIGKTTLVNQLLGDVSSDNQLYLNCDELPVQQALETRSLKILNQTIGKARRIVIDEAQRVENIGIVLKLLIDNRPELDIIATGSSSFELSNRVKEPLTGRSYEFMLEPLSLAEIQRHFSYSPLDIANSYERLMRYGGYPSVVLSNEKDIAEEISLIAERYVYKDTLELVELRQRQLLPRLLTALALQIGSEVSYNELANTLGVKLETIERYITILESAFIVYRLPALSANKRKQVTNRKRKVYFYDLGIRNALIKNLNPFTLRDDVGALWENFCMNERRKILEEQKKSVETYYWRGLYGEVDLVEMTPTTTSAFEFKWLQKPARAPKTFSETYPEATFDTINPNNLADWLIFRSNTS